MYILQIINSVLLRIRLNDTISYSTLFRVRNSSPMQLRQVYISFNPATAKIQK